MSEEPRMLRVLVFPDRPDVLLVYAKGERFWIPPLTPPLNRFDVAKAFAEHDIPASVGESVAGRFTQAMHRLANDERAQRASLDKLREAAQAVKITTSPSADTADKQRAELILEKQKADDEIRDLKTWLSQTSSRAYTTGVYEERRVFQAKKQRLTDLQKVSLAIQGRLSELKRVAHAEHSRTREQLFIKFARELLTDEEWDEAWAAVDLEQHPRNGTDHG